METGATSGWRLLGAGAGRNRTPRPSPGVWLSWGPWACRLAPVRSEEKGLFSGAGWPWLPGRDAFSPGQEEPPCQEQKHPKLQSPVRPEEHTVSGASSVFPRKGQKPSSWRAGPVSGRRGRKACLRAPAPVGLGLLICKWKVQVPAHEAMRLRKDCPELGAGSAAEGRAQHWCRERDAQPSLPARQVSSCPHFVDEETGTGRPGCQPRVPTSERWSRMPGAAGTLAPAHGPKSGTAWKRGKGKADPVLHPGRRGPPSLPPWR